MIYWFNARIAQLDPDPQAVAGRTMEMNLFSLLLFYDGAVDI